MVLTLLVDTQVEAVKVMSVVTLSRVVKLEKLVHQGHPRHPLILMAEMLLNILKQAMIT
jgi:hypothetical protein